MWAGAGVGRGGSAAVLSPARISPCGCLRVRGVARPRALAGARAAAKRCGRGAASAWGAGVFLRVPPAQHSGARGLREGCAQKGRAADCAAHVAKMICGLHRPPRARPGASRRASSADGKLNEHSKHRGRSSAVASFACTARVFTPCDALRPRRDQPCAAQRRNPPPKRTAPPPQPLRSGPPAAAPPPRAPAAAAPRRHSACACAAPPPPPSPHSPAVAAGSRYAPGRRHGQGTSQGGPRCR